MLIAYLKAQMLRRMLYMPLCLAALVCSNKELHKLDTLTGDVRSTA